MILLVWLNKISWQSNQQSNAIGSSVNYTSAIITPPLLRKYLLVNLALSHFLIGPCYLAAIMFVKIYDDFNHIRNKSERMGYNIFVTNTNWVPGNQSCRKNYLYLFGLIFFTRNASRDFENRNTAAHKWVATSFISEPITNISITFFKLQI